MKIKVLRRQARQAVTLAEQHEIQQKIRTLERRQRRQRQEIFKTEDEILWNPAKRSNLVRTYIAPKPPCRCASLARLAGGRVEQHFDDVWSEPAPW